MFTRYICDAISVRLLFTGIWVFCPGVMVACQFGIIASITFLNCIAVKLQYTTLGMGKNKILRYLFGSGEIGDRWVATSDDNIMGSSIKANQMSLNPAFDE